MMPLTFANVGEENMIKKVGGKPETRKFLENLDNGIGNIWRSSHDKYV